MSQKLILSVMLLSIVLFYSCGPSKKLKASQAEVEQLKAANSDLAAKNNDLQKQVSDLTTSKQSLSDEYSRYKTDCEATKDKLQAVEAILTDLQNSLEAMQKKIEDAMADFAGKGVDVSYKDGLVYVDMADNLLYKSGSAALGDSGKQALGMLANALNGYPNLKVIVVGNTDDKPAKKGSDNWSLSTERANGVVRVLVDDQVNPARLTAGGKGKFAPIADNSTEEGRAKNRRTEIILNPDLNKLWESVQQQ
jgi:chemotaxis protein MotB